MSIQFEEKTGTQNPFNGIDVGNRSTPALADLNGDNKVDLLVGESNGTVKYFENTGTSSNPQFTARTGTQNPLDGKDVGLNSTPVLINMDGDNDVDLVIGESTGTIKYFENTGSSDSPQFIERTGTQNPFNTFDVGSNSAPTLADLNGDNKLDAIVGEFGGIFKYFENTGTSNNPQFIERTGTQNPLNGRDVGATTTPSLVDMDQDGDYDVITGINNGNISYFENTGTSANPIFTPRTGTSNPFNGRDFGDNSAPTLANTDLDGDGDLDAVIGENTGVLFYFENTTIQNTNSAPTGINLSNNEVAENANGAVVGVVSTTDADTNDTHTYEILTAEVPFIIEENPESGEYELKTTSALDYETENEYTIQVKTTDNGGLSHTESFTISVNNVAENSAPTGINLSNNEVAENANGAVVGVVSTTDADTNDTHTYEILTAEVPFIIEENPESGEYELKTTSALDYETENEYTIQVKTTDNGGLSHTESFTISVNNVAETPPEINVTSTTLKVVEGSDEEAVVEVSVTGVSNAVTVEYRTEDILTQPGEDFTSKAGTLTFTTDETQQITIPITDNNTREEDETFKLILETPSTGAVIGDSETVITITDTLEATSNTTLPGGVENLRLTGTDNINGTGNNNANILTGNSGNNSLSGLGGHDTLTGNEGNDVLNGGSGNDSMVGGKGDDIYYVQSASDTVTEDTKSGTDRVISAITRTLENNVENLTLNGNNPVNGTGNNLNNVIVGNAQNNTLTGLGGNDNLNGGVGADTLVGGKGNDTYTVDNSGDVVQEVVNEGTDLVNSYVNYTLPDTVENLTLKGNADITGTGNDRHNQIVGSSGDDTLTGNAGADTFYFLSPSHGVDIITDFSGSDGEGDRIRVNHVNFGMDKGTLQGHQFVLGSAATESTHRFIYNSGDLFYDADGTGGTNPVHLATLTGAPVLVASDIFIF